MDPKITVLKTEKDHVADGAAEVLRDHLELAHQTPMASVAVVAVDRHGNIHFDYTTDSRIGLLGHLEYMKAQIAHEAD